MTGTGAPAGGTPSAADLLAGPRGRRLCWEAVGWLAEVQTGRNPMWRAWWDVGAALAVLRGVLAGPGLAGLAAAGDIDLLVPLARSVDAARYWQDPDDTDRVLAHPEVVDALQPVADALAVARAAAWWPAGMAPGAQAVVVPGTMLRPAPPHLAGAPTVLRRWSEEATSSRGGLWWSAPIWAPAVDEAARLGSPLPQLACTTRRLAQLGATGMLLCEDRDRGPDAWCWPVDVPAAAPSVEIAGPADWLALVDRHPLDVTASRASSWAEATGIDCRWLVPDWSQLAAEVAGVHMTVAGYLAVSGRALGIEPGVATLVAGWSPDETHWLRDVVAVAGEPTRWVTGSPGSAERWRLAGDDGKP